MFLIATVAVLKTAFTKFVAFVLVKYTDAWFVENVMTRLFIFLIFYALNPVPTNLFQIYSIPRTVN